MFPGKVDDPRFQDNCRLFLGSMRGEAKMQIQRIQKVKFLISEDAWTEASPRIDELIGLVKPELGNVFSSLESLDTLAGTAQ